MPKTTVVSGEQEQGGTATMDPPAEQQASEPQSSGDGKSRQLNVMVKLKNVSFKKTVATIGMDVEMGQIHPLDPYRFFCNARNNVTIKVEDEQGSLPGIVPDSVNSVVDIKQFSCNGEVVKCSMQFAVDDIDSDVLLAIRSKMARIHASRIGSADDEGDTGSVVDDVEVDEQEAADLFSGGDDGVDAEHAPQGADAWKSVKIDALKDYGVTAKQIAFLKEGGVKTLGKFGELGKKHGSFWHKHVNGIGKEIGGKIQDAYNAFGVANKHLFTDSPAASTDEADAILLSWKSSKNSSHVASAYSQYRDAEGADGYGYCIDKANGEFVLGGDREVVAEETEHATVEDAKAAAEALEREHLAAADDTPNSEAA